MKLLTVYALAAILLLVLVVEGKKRKHGKPRGKKSNEVDMRRAGAGGIGDTFRLYRQGAGARGRRGPGKSSGSGKRGRHHGKSSKKSSSASSELDRWEWTTSRPRTYEPQRWTTSRPWRTYRWTRTYSPQRWTTSRPRPGSKSDEFNWSDLWSSESDSEESSESDSEESSESSSKDSDSRWSRGSKKSRGKSRGKSKKHSRGSSKKHSKKSSGSKSSSSSEWSSEEDSSEMTPDWCEKWCYKWARHHFDRLFPYADVRFFWDRDVIIRNYCRELQEWTGGLCSNETTTMVPTNHTEWNTTTTPEYTTELPYTRPPQRCYRSSDCEVDECCATTNRYQAFCRKLSQVNEGCSTTIAYSWTRQVGQCQCDSGLECQRAGSIYSRSGTCRRTRTTTPEGRTDSGTRSTIDGRRMTTTPEMSSGTMDPSNTTIAPPDPTNSTMEPPVYCDTHMDCPFFQCCTNLTMGEDVAERGVCNSFSNEAEFCSTLGTFTELPIVPACPCQSFLKCNRAGNTENGAFGICI